MVDDAARREAFKKRYDAAMSELSLALQQAVGRLAMPAKWSSLSIEYYDDTTIVRGRTVTRPYREVLMTTSGNSECQHCQEWHIGANQVPARAGVGENVSWRSSDASRAKRA